MESWLVPRSGNLSDEADKILTSESRTLAPAAVLSQVVLMSVISIVTVLAFNLLRPKNKIIYEPKVKYHVGAKPPPRISSSLFGWLPPLIHTKEPELLDKLGLDAVTFLRFLRLMRWLITGVALMVGCILIPINVVYNLKHVSSSGRDALSMLTIRDISGDILFVAVGVTYLITLFILGIVHMHWKAMIHLRSTWFHSPEYQTAFYARTLSVMHVPKKYQSDEGLRAIFESVQVPYPTTSVHIGRSVGRLPQLIEYHNNTVRELEGVLVRYLKDGKIGKKRPTIRQGGFLGIGGQTFDAIDFYAAKLKRTEAAIQDYRMQIDTRKAENYGFASMAAVPYAHVVAKILADKHPKRTDITLAPNPKDIIWDNMNKSDGEIARKKVMGTFWLGAVCFFNTVPLFIISVLANLATLTVYVPFLDDWSNASPASFDFISGVLPSVVSAFFSFFLPIIMRWLTRYMGALTHSRLDRAVVARYYAFLVLSQLVIFTLIGVIFNCVKEIVSEIGNTSWKDIISNLSYLPDTINRTYIDQSPYWLTYFPLRGFLVVFDLAQIFNLVWISFKTHAFGRTPRDIREWTQPPEFRYAIYYSNILFMGTVALVFAPLAPLVAIEAAVVFWISSFVYKYQLMFVYVSKVESGGRLWNVVINRLLISVVLMQALMVLTIGIQLGFKSLLWISTVPPIFIVIAYKVYINRTFHPQFLHYEPTEEELRLAKVHSERADLKGHRLEKRFGHPGLHAELFTPMLHANMMPLLGQVFSGKIGKSSAKLDEYGGQKMDARVIEGGIKIAAVDQNDLEYDPALYQRDRGELDWDARSMASTNILMERSASPAPSLPRNSSFFASKEAGAPTSSLKYEQYLSNGNSKQDMELLPIDSPNEPLLSARAQYYPVNELNYSQSAIQSPPSLYQEPMNTSQVRMAPLHRPRTNTSDASELSPYSVRTQTADQQYPPYYTSSTHLPQNGYRGEEPQEQNMAGRGTSRFI
ncbi:DUF221-domain-containing protein [Fistulina hepatica ATCC 64428]|uniref:DUF221-domain-containing protein n=1 Tax=Fistulina hepatica ATCC 64428 TaxID=1128425 RepID=A0A0D7AG47_9AGAR|nr:DUF221-domain-containing protein [Fistulina hepatica ATCC 64428]